MLTLETRSISRRKFRQSKGSANWLMPAVPSSSLVCLTGFKSYVPATNLYKLGDNSLLVGLPLDLLRAKALDCVQQFLDRQELQLLALPLVENQVKHLVGDLERPSAAGDLAELRVAQQSYVGAEGTAEGGEQLGVADLPAGKTEKHRGVLGAVELLAVAHQAVEHLHEQLLGEAAEAAEHVNGLDVVPRLHAVHLGRQVPRHLQHQGAILEARGCEALQNAQGVEELEL
ncbi:histidine kinase [Babesia caballi]|uniref:Histidine kinase n=1 Tax=Babesia caballi TaxID=5871 RepID=A0AAV4LX69_BABCB|nr:histidine kinase [Babesia caballi]